jgi:adenine-specific DNA-methyltransferase
MRRGEIWTVAGGKDLAGKPGPVVILQADRFDATASITVCGLHHQPDGGARVPTARPTEPSCSCVSRPRRPHTRDRSPCLQDLTPEPRICPRDGDFVVDPQCETSYRRSRNMLVCGKTMLAPTSLPTPQLGRLLVEDAARFLAALEPGSVDLIVSSPPYFMGKEYDTSVDIEDFIRIHRKIAPLLKLALKPGGNLCWQVGNHVRNGVAIPLDMPTYSAFATQTDFRLRNRIVWTFGHGPHCTRRLSGRYETILWFSNGDNYYFDLDAIRVPQKYPGKRHYKGPRRGEWSGNPRGKNPGDVWDIPNVKSSHVEKTGHPCQFPVALVQRLVRALCPPKGIVVDCFAGSATTGVAALIEGRHFLGCDTNPLYVAIGNERLEACARGTLRYRSVDIPVMVPSQATAVARTPAHFIRSAEGQ